VQKYHLPTRGRKEGEDGYEEGLWVLVVLLGVLALLNTSAEASVLTITEALEMGKVAVEARGAGITAVSVSIRKTTEEGFEVLIPAGTYSLPKVITRIFGVRGDEPGSPGTCVGKLQGYDRGSGFPVH